MNQVELKITLSRHVSGYCKAVIVREGHGDDQIEANAAWIRETLNFFLTIVGPRIALNTYLLKNETTQPIKL